MGRSHENKNTQSTPSGSEYATPSKPSIKRIVVNGDTYAVSRKEKKEPNQKVKLTRTCSKNYSKKVVLSTFCGTRNLYHDNFSVQTPLGKRDDVHE